LLWATDFYNKLNVFLGGTYYEQETDRICGVWSFCGISIRAEYYLTQRWYQQQQC
jgi:hypothetical protein